MKLKLFRLSGELRFTRQFNDSVLNVSQLNQAEVLRRRPVLTIPTACSIPF